MQTNDLLIELGMEEIPALRMKCISEQLLKSFEAILDEYAWPHASLHGYAAPRQMAVATIAIAGEHALEPVTYRGPRLTAAYQDNQLTAAAIKWMSRFNITESECHVLSCKKGEFLAYTAPPQSMQLKELIDLWLLRLPAQFSKEGLMRWTEQATGFIRPLRWLVVLWGTEVLPCRFLGIEARRQSRGHRLQGYPMLELSRADDYAQLLAASGGVMPEYTQRKALIWSEAHRVAAEHGFLLHPDEQLLEEITGLVACPMALLGSFDRVFLSIPEPVLVTTMKQDQRYFPVYDEMGRLMPHFVVIVDGLFTSIDALIKGHERVLSARFADAQFFWKQDLAVALIDRVSLLAQIQLHPQLGSLREKADRIVCLAASLAELWDTDVSLAKRAALLAKADLSTELVREFPSLQGVLGGCYGGMNQEPEAVCTAIAEQYHPKSVKDYVPEAPISVILGLADRLEHLAGFFSIGYAPTGEKDPFGLRRAALGIVRLLIENHRTLDLRALIRQAISLFPNGSDACALAEQLYSFISARLAYWYQEQGVSLVYLDAISHHLSFRTLLEHHQVLQELLQAERAELLNRLSSAHLRLVRLLQHLKLDLNQEVSGALSESELELLKIPREKWLYTHVRKIEIAVQSSIDQKKFWWNIHTWRLLSELSEKLSLFFDEVRVQVEDVALKQARIHLLQYVHRVFLYFADFSKLVRLFNTCFERQ